MFFSASLKNVSFSFAKVSKLQNSWKPSGVFPSEIFQVRKKISHLSFAAEQFFLTYFFWLRLVSLAKLIL
jgi:hypothetical protein